MTSFDYRLNPIYAIKECSSCGSLYTSNCGCSKGSLEDKILVPKPPRNCVRCARCGTPVDGPIVMSSLLRKKFMEVFVYKLVWKMEFFKDSKTLPDQIPDDNTNIVNAPREPIIVNQDPGEKSSPSPLHIDHCCHECGDSLDGIFCRQCTCKSLGKLMEQMTTLRDLVGQAIQKKEEEKRIAEEQAAKDRSWKIPICHLDTIPETESDEFIKSSVEDLVPIPSESEGIPDKMCDVPLCENTTPLNTLNEHSEIVVNSNDDNSSSDDDYPYGEDIDYVDASPPDVEIVILEVVEMLIQKLEGLLMTFF
ncbi:hypothetical protein Tco_0167146 [Tanacetum coccineum]